MKKNNKQTDGDFQQSYKMAMDIIKKGIHYKEFKYYNIVALLAVSIVFILGYLRIHWFFVINSVGVMIVFLSYFRANGDLN